MKHFLIPTDFSPVANQALAFGIHLAKKMKAEISVMHVFDHQLLETDLLPFHIDEGLAKGELPEAEEQLGLYVETLMRKEGTAVSFEVIIQDGFPKEQILERSKAGSFDLIIMGTTGATNRLETFFGSTTSAVMLDASCPVLAIPSNSTFQEIEKIAYATEFSETSSKNFYELNRFAKMLGASIHAVHVESKKISEEDLELVELSLPAMEFDQIPIHIVQGKNVAEGLQHFIEQEGIQLLAIEPHHYSFPQLLWKKSVTRTMVLNAHIPILSIRNSTTH